MNDNLSRLSPDQLFARCAEQATKKNATIRDDQYCFELIRRAFQSDDDYVLGLVLHIYKTIWSRSWIRNPHVFNTHPWTAEDFKSQIFFDVYRRFKGSNLSAFPSLNHFLSYLRITLVRRVAAYYRSREMRDYTLKKTKTDNGDDIDKMDLLPSDDNPSQQFEHDQIWQNVDQRVKTLLTNTHDRILFNCWIKLDLSYDEILQHYGQFWHDKNEIRVARQRILRQLKGDPILRNLLKNL
jgi:hypothetical protein